MCQNQALPWRAFNALFNRIGGLFVDGGAALVQALAQKVQITVIIALRMRGGEGLKILK